MANRAAWIQSAQSHPFVVSDAPMPSPGPSFITIRVHAVAINPADAAIQLTGMLVDTYPAILGCDGAGTVTAVGSNVTRFKVGDRVTGLADHAEETAGQGTFALYCNLRQDLVAKIPEGVEFKEACVLPCGLATAAYSLFEEKGLQLGMPGSGKGKGKVVFIWEGVRVWEAVRFSWQRQLGMRSLPPLGRRTSSIARVLARTMSLTTGRRV